MRNLVMLFSAVGWASLPADFALSYGHANAFGGSTAHSWVATGHSISVSSSSRMGLVSYGTAYRPPGGAYAYGYHPPTTVGYYGAGCYDCGGNTIGGAMAGAAVGAVIASNAYARGNSSGVSNEVVVPAPSYPVGLNMAALPEDCVTAVVHGGTYYLCGNAWFSPFYGASGVYYRVVPTP